MSYDDRIFTAIEIGEARERHGVKLPQCRSFECTGIAAPDPLNPHELRYCTGCQRETNEALDRMEDDRDRRMGV